MSPTITVNLGNVQDSTTNSSTTDATARFWIHVRRRFQENPVRIRHFRILEAVQPEDAGIVMLTLGWLVENADKVELTRVMTGDRWTVGMGGQVQFGATQPEAWQLRAWGKTDEGVSHHSSSVLQTPGIHAAAVVRSPAHLVLGVAPDATRDEIRAAYRKLVKETHPDHGGDARRFMEVHAAYETLIRKYA